MNSNESSDVVEGAVEMLAILLTIRNEVLSVVQSPHEARFFYLLSTLDSIVP